MIPKDNEEAQIIQCFTLSIKGGMSGVEVEYLIIKDFSKKYHLDSIELLQIIKSMAGELNSGK
jgi:hypothetical protein